MISIHAPRGGSDCFSISPNAWANYFNPRSPWGERPLEREIEAWKENDFNPRSPWGERRGAGGRGAGKHRFQSTLPVGGATMIIANPTVDQLISIHAPRGGSDRLGAGYAAVGVDFNPRSPWGERLCEYREPLTISVISIHAPRGGSDRRPLHRPVYQDDFNPRSPWGERPTTRTMSSPLSRFQSTLPVGGATNQGGADSPPERFQSTLPVGGATHGQGQLVD